MQSLEDFKAKFAVDEAHYVGDMANVLASLQPVCLHLLGGVNTDRSEAADPRFDFFINNEVSHIAAHTGLSAFQCILGMLLHG